MSEYSSACLAPVRLFARARRRAGSAARGSVGRLVLVAAMSAATAPAALAAQSSPTARTSTPEDAAALFLRSVRAIQWSATARLLAPEALEEFRVVVVSFSEADTTGGLRRALVQTDAAGLAALTPEEIFTRSVSGVIEGMPGLMHALYDRDDEVLGHVAEGPDQAHVVYRTTARLSGAVPEVKVMRLTRTSEGWRVAWSDELEVLEAAVRGVGRQEAPT